MTRLASVHRFLPLACALFAVVVASGPVLAAGRSWQVQPVPNPGAVRQNDLLGVVALSPTLAWAVGRYHTDPSSELVLIERYNGSAWTQVPGVNPSSHSFLVNVAADSPADVWASGAYLGEDGIFHALTERYNGGGWSAVPAVDVPGAIFNDLTGIAVLAPNNVFATGAYQYAYDGPFYPLAEHWNGSSWSIVSAPAGGANGGYLYRVGA